VGTEKQNRKVSEIYEVAKLKVDLEVHDLEMSDTGAD
jgi:hypothetical protein